MVGLHPCGNLSNCIIKSFIRNDKCRGIVIIPCCYHFNSDPDDVDQGIEFPLSHYIQREHANFKLSKASKNLASQSVDRMNDAKRCEEKMFSLTLLAYRIILQKILHDSKDHLGEKFNLDSIKIGRRYHRNKKRNLSDIDSLGEYVNWASTKLISQGSISKELKEIIISDETIKVYERSLSQILVRLEEVQKNRTELAYALEMCIILDRNSIPFITTYHFMCKRCNPSKEEVFNKKQANFAVMCQTALANLLYKNEGKIFFSKEKDLIPFLEEHWEELTTQPRRQNDSWHANIHKTIVSNEIFKKYEINDDVYVTLINNDLSKIGPSYDRFKALTSQLKTTISSSKDSDSGGDARKRKSSHITPSMSASGQGYHLAMNEDFPSSSLTDKNFVATNSRSTRRNNTGSGGHFFSSVSNATTTTTTGQIMDTTTEGKSKLNAFGMPIDHPLNREGYSYILVESDPHAQGRQLWDECEFTGGKPIPGLFYRVVHTPALILSQNDKAIHLKLSENQLNVTGEKGYGAVRATHSVHLGIWYFECEIIEQPENSTTRIGWAQNLANLQAPIGYDKFGYSWRSLMGTVFHEAYGKHYAEEGYTKGDVIGCLIDLPPRQRDRLASMDNMINCPTTSDKSGNKKVTENSKNSSLPASVVSNQLWNFLPETYKDKPLIKFKNSFYFEDRQEPQKAEKHLVKLPKSRIVFFKNGISQGEAFTDLYLGSYFPAISIYKSATVSVNFGPDFKFPPVNDFPSYKPVSERIVETDAEQCLADMIYLVDKEGLVETLVAKCIETNR